jgi:hypothetical protein
MTHASAKASPPPVAANKRQRLIFIAIACCVALAAGVWLIGAAMRDDTPRLNESAVVLTKFIESKQFDRMPFEQQRQFYKVLDDRDAELDQAFAASKITESEYRAGLEAAWLGKHINRVEKYYSLAPGVARTNYLTKLVDKKERKTTKPKAGPDKINADETAAEMKVEKWPSALRAQWESFHEAYRTQRKAIEKASAATKPTATSHKK